LATVSSTRQLGRGEGHALGRVQRFFHGLATVVVRGRYAVLVLWLIAVGAANAALPSLSREVNNENSAFLPASAPSQRATELATPLLGGKHGSVLLIVAGREGGITPQDAALVKQLAAELAKLPKVRSVQYGGISANGQAAQLRLQVAIPPNQIERQLTLIEAVEKRITALPHDPGLKIAPAGQIATAVANQRAANRTGKKVQEYSVLLIIVLLLAVFRAPLAALVTMLPPFLALAIANRVIGWLGAHGLSISSVTQVLLIVLLLGAGTDYGLFLVFRVREELREGREPKEAVVRALTRVGESITASASTVVLALLTLLLASFGLYHDLGAPLAIGMVIALVMGLTLLPALLAIAGRAAFWPTIPRKGGRQQGWWGRVAARLVSRPALTLGLGVGLFALLALGALDYRSGGFGGATTAPAGSKAALGNALLRRDFPQTAANPANLIFAFRRPVYLEPAPLQRIGAALASSRAFRQLAGPLDPNGTTLSPAQLTALYRRLGPPQRLPLLEPPGLGIAKPLYNAYRATAQFISAEGTVIQFEATLTVGSQQSTAALNATARIRRIVAAAAAAGGAVRSGLAGEAAALYDVSTTANNDLVRIIPVAAVAITLLLAAVLRSLVAPLYLIVSVVLSYLAALGLSTLVFITIGGEGGLVFILPFLMFVFLLALGEDYNILVMTRIREEAHSLPLRQAVVRAIGRTGTTVTSAGVILGGTFAVFGIFGAGGSNSHQLQAIGFGLAAGILMDTFIVRSLLVPSLVILLGRINWWPSSLGGERPSRSLPSNQPALRQAD